MSVLRYAKNLARSAKNVAVDVAADRAPAIASIVKDAHEAHSSDDSVLSALKETRSILKEDVGDVLRKGWDNTKRAVKTGELHRGDAEMDDMMGDLFGGEGFDNSFLDDNWDPDGGEGGGSAKVAAKAAAAGAAAGVAAAAARLGSSPEARVTAEAGLATARFTRVSASATISMGNAVRAAVNANTRVLAQMHQFQLTQQAQYYKQSAANQAAALMHLHNVSEKLNTVIQGLAVTSSASDQLTQAMLGKTDDFSRMFASGGGFDVSAYVRLGNQRLKEALWNPMGPASMLKGIARNPLPELLKLLVANGAFRQLAQFDRFVGNIGGAVLSRGMKAGKALFEKHDTLQFLAAHLGLDPFAQKNMRKGPDLSKMVRGKPVAFDGYAHRALVEVIPTHLSHIHAELVSLRKGFAKQYKNGAQNFAHVGDNLAYNYDTGQMQSTAEFRRQAKRGMDQSLVWEHRAKLDQIMGQSGVLSQKQLDKIMAHTDPAVRRRNLAAANRRLVKSDKAREEGFLALVDGGFELPHGNHKKLEEALEAFALRHASTGDKDRSAAIRRYGKELVAARQKHGARFSMDFDAALRGGRRSRDTQWDNFAGPGQEGIHRQAYNLAGGLGDIGATLGGASAIKKVSALQQELTRQEAQLESLRLAGKGKLIPTEQLLKQGKLVQDLRRRHERGETEAEPGTWGLTGREGEGYVRSSKAGSAFRDSDGKMTLRSLAAAPGVLLSRAMDSFETRVSEFLFGNDSDDAGGIFGRIKRSLIGDVDASGRRSGGLFGNALQKGSDFMSQVKEGFRSRILDPLGKALFGEEYETTNPATGASVLSRKGGLFSKLKETITERIVDPIKKGMDSLWKKVNERFIDPAKKAMGEAWESVKTQAKTFYYGDKDKGVKGFAERFVDPAREFVKSEIWDPMKRSMEDIWEKTRTFLKKEVWEPMKKALEPFVTEAKEQWRLLKDGFSSAVKGVGAQIDETFKKSFGSSLSDMLKKNVLDPIKNALDSVKKFLGNALASVLKIPVNVLRNVSDQLKLSQLKRGVGQISAAERARLIHQYNLDPATIPHSGGSSLTLPGQPKPPLLLPAPSRGSGGSSLTLPGQPKPPLLLPAPSRGSDGGLAQIRSNIRASLERQTLLSRRTDAIVDAERSDLGQIQGKMKDSLAKQPALQHSTLPSVAQPAPGGTDSHGAAADSGQVRGGSRSASALLRAAQATADNTHNIYQFLQANLKNVGRNVAAIARKITGGKGGPGAADGGGNWWENLGARAKSFLKNPLGAITGYFGGLMDRVTNGFKTALEKVKGVILLPFKWAAEGVKKAIAFVGEIREGLSKMVGMVKDAAVSAVKTVGGLAKDLFLGASEVIGKGLKNLGEALPSLAEGLGKLASTTIEVGAKFAKGLMGVVDTLGRYVAKWGGALLRGAGNLAGSVLGGVTGVGRKGWHRVTPVYVMGGYLAGTEGGAKSLVEAESGLTSARSLVSSATKVASKTASVLSDMRDLMASQWERLMGVRLPSGMGQGGNRRLRTLRASASRGIAASRRGLGALASRLSGWATSQWVQRHGGVHQSDAVVSGGGGLNEHMLEDERAPLHGPSRGPGDAESIRQRVQEGAFSRARRAFQSRLIAASEGATRHLGALRKGFTGLWNLLPLLASGLVGIVQWFTHGGIAKLLVPLLGQAGTLRGAAGLIGRGLGAAGSALGGAALGAAKLAGKGLWHGNRLVVQGALKGAGAALKLPGLVGRGAMGLLRGAPAAAGAVASGAGGLLSGAGRLVGGAAKVLGKGGVVGILGMGADMVADRMEEGSTGQRVVRTGGKMATYGALGAMLGGPVGAVIGAGVGAVVANWDKISAGFSSVSKTVADKWTGVVDEVGKRWSCATACISNKWSAAVDWVGNAWSGVTEFAQNKWSAMTDGLAHMWAGVTGAASKGWDWVIGKVSRAWDWFLGKLGFDGDSKIVDTVKTVGSAIKTGLTTVWNYSPLGASVNLAWKGIDALTGGDCCKSGKEPKGGAAKLDPIKVKAPDQIKADPLQGLPANDNAAPSTSAVKQSGGFWDTLRSVAGSAVDTVKEVGSHGWSGVKGAGSAILKGDFSGAAQAAKTGFRGAKEAVKTGVADVKSIIKGEGDSNRDILLKTAIANGMTDPKEQAAFLAQMDHESGGFRKLKENLNYTPERLMQVFPSKFKSIEEARSVAAGGQDAIAERIYSGRMGNSEAGDGSKFRGRGMIQLTGRDNYTRASQALGLDLVNHPELAEDPENASKIAMWYWKDRKLGDKAKAGDIVGVRKGINGGAIGLEDTQRKTAKYLADLQSGKIATPSGDTIKLASVATPAPTAVGTELAVMSSSAQASGIVGPAASGMGSGLSSAQKAQIAKDRGASPAQVAAIRAGAAPTAVAQGAALTRDQQRSEAAQAPAQTVAQAVANATQPANQNGPIDPKLFERMLAVLEQIAGSTSRAADTQLTPEAMQQAIAGVVSAGGAQAAASTANIFALNGANGGGRGPRPMSPGMQRVVAG